jgi:hypothetical protein
MALRSPVLLLLLACALELGCAQFFQFQQGAGQGINLEDLMGGGGGGFFGAGSGGGGQGGFEEMEEEKEEEEVLRAHSYPPRKCNHTLSSHTSLQVDLYERLNLEPEASDRDIKKAYRKLSVEYHPDKNPGQQAIERFREITEAYEMLSDKEKRVIYDSGGIGAVKKMREGESQGGGSPFDMFFGGGQQKQGNRGRNMDIEMPVTLEVLLEGTLLASLAH